MIILRKLFLAIVGGIVAASGFYWYLDQENPLLQMAEQYQQHQQLQQPDAVPAGGSGKLLELPDIDLGQWNKTELFSALSQTFDLTKNLGQVEELALVGKGSDPLLEHWIRGLLNERAERTGKAPLTEEARASMVNLLLNMRELAQRSALGQRTGESLTDDERVRVGALMAKGEVLFSQALGVPLSEFMATLTKEDMRALFNPSPRA